MSNSKKRNRNLGLWVAAVGCTLACSGAARAAEAPAAQGRPFPDVPRNHWAYEAVEELRRLGILQGYPAAPPAAEKQAAARRPAPPRVPPRRR